MKVKLYNFNTYTKISIHIRNCYISNELIVSFMLSHASIEFTGQNLHPKCTSNNQNLKPIVLGHHCIYHKTSQLHSWNTSFGSAPHSYIATSLQLEIKQLHQNSEAYERRGEKPLEIEQKHIIREEKLASQIIDVGPTEDSQYPRGNLVDRRLGQCYHVVH